MWNVNFRSPSDAFFGSPRQPENGARGGGGGTSFVAAVNLFRCKTTTDDGIRSLSLFFRLFVGALYARVLVLRDALLSDFASWAPA